MNVSLSFQANSFKLNQNGETVRPGNSLFSGCFLVVQFLSGILMSHMFTFKLVGKIKSLLAASQKSC